MKQELLLVLNEGHGVSTGQGCRYAVKMLLSQSVPAPASNPFVLGRIFNTSRCSSLR